LIVVEKVDVLACCVERKRGLLDAVVKLESAIASLIINRRYKGCNRMFLTNSVREIERSYQERQD